MLTERKIFNLNLWRSLSIALLMVIGIHSSAAYAMIVEPGQDVSSYAGFGYADVDYAGVETEAREAREGLQVIDMNLSRDERSFVQGMHQSADHCVAVDHGDVCNSGGCCPALNIGFSVKNIFSARSLTHDFLQVSFYKIVLSTDIRPPIIIPS